TASRPFPTTAARRFFDVPDRSLSGLAGRRARLGGGCVGASRIRGVALPRLLARSARAAMENEDPEPGKDRGREAVEPERLDRIAGRVPEKVGDQPDGGRPADPAERVP